MPVSPLSIVIPVKCIDAAASDTLRELAKVVPTWDIVAVGKMAVADAVPVPNLRIVDCDCSIYAAMNLGAQAAQSDYLLFMGIDDHLLAENAGTIAAGLRDLHGASLVVLPFRVAQRLVKQRPIQGRLQSFHHQGVLFHRQTVLDLDGYSARYRLHSDLDLMFRVQRAGTVSTLDVPLVTFSKGGMTTSGRHSLLSIREISAIYAEHEVSRICFAFVQSVVLLLWYRVRFIAKQHGSRSDD